MLSNSVKQLHGPHRELAAYGLKRIVDMTRDELEWALRETLERHMLILADRSKDTVKMTFEDATHPTSDMDFWNSVLEELFYGDAATKAERLAQHP